jgi:hypothetical protein
MNQEIFADGISAVHVTSIDPETSNSDLGSGGATRGGSTPLARTKLRKSRLAGFTCKSFFVCTHGDGLLTALSKN